MFTKGLMRPIYVRAASIRRRFSRCCAKAVDVVKEARGPRVRAAGIAPDIHSSMPHSPSASLLAAWAPLLPVDDTGIVAHQAPDFFALWEALEKEIGAETEVPYWAAIWPGARLLARYLLDNPEAVAGKCILEFGAGGAVASIAAMKSGAKVAVANDIDPGALSVAMKNCAVNGVTLVCSGNNLLAGMEACTADIVLVADMFYERSTAEALYDFLLRQRVRGAQVYVADGCRAFTPKTGMTELRSGRFAVNKPLEGCGERTVTLYRMEP
jgi:predicted nicotinamide N-methyase